VFVDLGCGRLYFCFRSKNGGMNARCVQTQSAGVGISGVVFVEGMYRGGRKRMNGRHTY